jgi:hypothetical protein
MKMQQASYSVNYHIELSGETHTITEIIIKLCAAKMAECIFDEQAKNKLETIQLLNNTVHRHIQDLSVDTEHKLVT